MEKCPKCKRIEKVKNGFIRGLQRYRCKECAYNYTVEQKSTASSPSKKRLALEMYLEGLGFNSIGRILKVSHVSVLNWIESFGKNAESIRSEKEVEVIELDEMHTYIGQKKTIVGYGLLLIEMGESSSTSYWVAGTRKNALVYGKKLQTRIRK